MTEEAMDWFIRLQEMPDDGRTADAFKSWLAIDTRHGEAFGRIEKLMSMPALREASRRDAARLGATKPRAGHGWMKYAASIAAIFVLVLGYIQYPALLLRWQADHLTQAGEQKTVTLPDGSEMHLNTASAVALDFAGGRRHVKLLAGEAFFDVRPDSARPFAVTAQFSETMVKGTAFAVRNEDNEDVILLERGRVAVSRLAAPNDEVELTPGQAVAADAASISKPGLFDLQSALAWREGRIVFQEESLARALSELDRYYDGTVLIASGRLDALKVSGSYRIDDPETAILTVAAAVGASETRLPGGLIILY
jgi:transmembrane sensor